MENKLKNFSEVLACTGNGINQQFLTDDELLSLEYDTFFDD